VNVPGRRASWLERADRLGRGVENSLLCALLAAMLFLGGAQILLRNLGGGGFPWADEALRVMVLWLAMLGGLAASRDDRHIAIDALARILPPRWQAAASALVSGLTAAVCALIGWHALIFVGESREFGDKLVGGLPAWWFQSILPVAFLLIAWRYAVWALKRARAVVTGEPGR
jgi:TRAP-type C4-dicarboxylate transport system permease small subunit